MSDSLLALLGYFVTLSSLSCAVEQHPKKFRLVGAVSPRPKLVETDALHDKPDFKFSVYLEHMFWTVRPSMVPNTSRKSEDETRLARKLRKWTARLQKLHGAKVVASTRHFSSYNASLHRCATLPQKVRIPKDQQTFTDLQILDSKS